jgi:nucleoside phosphorylase
MSDTIRPKRPSQDYAVGWITALAIEYAAAKALLDEEHEPLPRKDGDPNLYTLGRIGQHNVVITCLPAGSIGNDAAATVVANLSTAFPLARIALMVGIGGGVSTNVDVRLGDVVVSHPGDGNPGVIQYDFGKAEAHGKYRRTKHLDKPPSLLLHALNEVRSNQTLGRNNFESHLAKLEQYPAFSRAKAEPDRLFESTYNHDSGPSCAGCDEQKLVKRDDRPLEELVEIHYGTIASGNTVMKDAAERDRICQDLGCEILCFEMEAAGLMNNFPCLVIRGICDYADSHKNKTWQPYAAATAAAYAKEILSVISPQEVTQLELVRGMLELPTTLARRWQAIEQTSEAVDHELEHTDQIFHCN